MNLILQIIFIALVIADTVLTYKIIRSGKGVEVGEIAEHYIQNHALTIAISVAAVGLLLLWLNFVRMVWMLIPAIIYMGRLCWKNWRVLNGR